MIEESKIYYLKTLQSFGVDGYSAMAFFFNHYNSVVNKYKARPNKKNKKMLNNYCNSENKFNNFLNLLCKIAYYSDDEHILNIYKEFSNNDFPVAKSFLVLIYNHDFIKWAKNKLLKDDIIN